jgi:hypothetical protein
MNCTFSFSQLAENGKAPGCRTVGKIGRADEMFDFGEVPGGGVDGWMSGALDRLKNRMGTAVSASRTVDGWMGGWVDGWMRVRVLVRMGKLIRVGVVLGMRMVGVVVRQSSLTRGLGVSGGGCGRSLDRIVGAGGFGSQQINMDFGGGLAVALDTFGSQVKFSGDFEFSELLG